MRGSSRAQPLQESPLQLDGIPSRFSDGRSRRGFPLRIKRGDQGIPDRYRKNGFEGRIVGGLIRDNHGDATERQMMQSAIDLLGCTSIVGRAAPGWRTMSYHFLRRAIHHRYRILYGVPASCLRMSRRRSACRDRPSEAIALEAFADESLNLCKSRMSRCNSKDRQAISRCTYSSGAE